METTIEITEEMRARKRVIEKQWEDRDICSATYRAKKKRFEQVFGVPYDKVDIEGAEA